MVVRQNRAWRDKISKMSRIEGEETEEFFVKKLVVNELLYNKVNLWYDFEVYGKKVEVKSCQISVKNGKGDYKIGRFDFTKEENRKLQRKHNIWICFIVREQGQMIILGFCKARSLPKKRYITLHEIRKIPLISKETFFERIRP